MRSVAPRTLYLRLTFCKMPVTVGVAQRNVVPALGEDVFIKILRVWEFINSNGLPQYDRLCYILVIQRNKTISINVATGFHYVLIGAGNHIIKEIISSWICLSIQQNDSIVNFYSCGIRHFKRN